MTWRTVRATAAIVGGVLLAAGGLAYAKYAAIRRAAAGGWGGEAPETVLVVAAEAGTHQRSMTAAGTIAAIRHVTIATEVAGKVVEVGFESGQMVEAGALLVRLDASTEEAELRSARAAAELARVTVDRLRQPDLGRAVSQQDVDKATAEQEQALARVQQLEAMIAKKEVRAAFAGRVGMRDIHPGQYVSEGQRITTLQGVSDEVHVDFWVPQQQAAALRVGSTVHALVGAGEVPARVVAMDAQVEQTTRNVRVRAAMPSLDGRLAPGMFVDVRVPLGEPAHVVTAPATAIRRAPFGDHVFVIEPDAKDPQALRARQRFIRIGGAAGDRVIVSEGLAPGERIAADGSFKLREGSLVAAAPASAAAVAPRPGAG